MKLTKQQSRVLNKVGLNSPQGCIEGIESTEIDKDTLDEP